MAIEALFHDISRRVPAPLRPMFALRLELFAREAQTALAALYGWREDYESWLARIVEVTADAYVARPAALRSLDLERLHQPDWFQDPSMLGYSTYVDRFAGTLAGLAERLDHLDELGIRYLHLLPVTVPREGACDGGYAVADYERVDPALGSVADLEHLAGLCRERRISLVTDLVLNHCADSHEWARRARAGNALYRAYFHSFPDRREPDLYEESLPQVFPVSAPGNFTWVPEMDRWVWTTFYPYQWDLNYANPAVFAEMLGVMFAMANRGIEVLRLDSVAYLWKRTGTDCRNQPEVHLLLRAFRALIRIAAPALALKAEAIVAPEHLTAYLGEGAYAGRECQIGYHNTLMVLLWSALAEGRAERLTRMLRRMPAPPANTAWITYLRCHDDIGWPVLDVERPEEETPSAHVRFLSAFYAGTLSDSFARGAPFQADSGRSVHGSSGMLASLAGLEAALEADDQRAVDLALARILMLHAVIFAFGGIPLLYMGDEIGLLNDYSFRDDPARAGDTRWLHRPAMDWERAALRHDPDSVEGRLFGGLKRLATLRRSTPALHADTPSRPLSGENSHLLILRRAGARGRLLLVADFSGERQEMSAAAIRSARFDFPLLDRLSGRRYEEAGPILLGPYDALWLVEPDA